MRALGVALLASIALSLATFLVADYCGLHRLLGYELQVDINSGRILRVDYRLIRPDLRTVFTNGISSVAAQLSGTSNPEWIVAVRRPRTGRRSEGIPESALLPALNVMSNLLASSDLSATERTNLVRDFLSQMRTNSPKAVANWADGQWNSHFEK